MPVTNLSDIGVGTVISFKTINPHDNVRYAGKVVCVCDFKTASSMEDTIPYYTSVKRAYPDIKDKEQLRYFVLEMDTFRRVMALEFIDLSSAELLKENTHVDFRVYDIDESKRDDILRNIKSLGYIVEIVT